MKKFFLLLLTLTAFGLQLSAQANLSVQGTLQNFDGSAVTNGDYDLIFKLYTVATGGIAVWEETQTVRVTGGVYSVLLGETTPLTAAFDQTYYLGITLPGGPELTPRSRLTSSPYALSLIGQDNIFPSTGAIGAGTASPAAGYQLHVANAAGDGKLLVEGTGVAEVNLKTGSSTQSISYDGTALNIPGTTNLDGDVNISGTATINTLVATNFNYSPTDFAITGKLAVGQASVDANNVLKVAGRSLFTSMLEVNGSLSDFGGVHKGAYCDYGHCGTNSVAIPTSIRASNAIVAGGGLWSVSDLRIKKDIQSANAVSDLSLLRKLRVKNYAYIDEIGKGTRTTNGFIAQEVAGLFPEAISLSSEFIPSIYQRTQSLKKQGSLLTVALDNEHKLVAGEQVKIILPDDAQQVLEVKSTPSARSFTIEWEQEVPETIFVYGKKVDDFHTVDYDRIFTLNVSATQELARQVEQLKADNEALRKENLELRHGLNSIESRLSKMENMATGTAQK